MQTLINLAVLLALPLVPLAYLWAYVTASDIVFAYGYAKKSRADWSKKHAQR